MQLTAVLILGLSLTLCARTVSQTVTFSAKEVKLEKVFQVIKEQTGYTIAFSKEQIRNAKKISVDEEGTPLEKFLTSVLKETPFRYVI